MTQSLTVRRVAFALAIALGMTLQAAAAQPTVQAKGLACAWGDASFDEDCAMASTTAQAKANELAQSAWTKIASAPFKGTLYRNGGYFGAMSSDDAIENVSR